MINRESVSFFLLNMIRSKAAIKYVSGSILVRATIEF